MEKEPKIFDKQAYNNDYKRQNYDRITALLRKEEGAQIRQDAAAAGVSVTEYVRRAVEHYRTTVQK